LASVLVKATESFRSNQLVVWVAVGAAAILLGLQLFVPPIIGLADNGDFDKVMGYAGFQHVADSYEDKYFSWAVTKFAIVRPFWYRSGYFTSETLLAFLARYAAVPFASGHVFDIRVLGALHIVLLLTAIGLLVASGRDLSHAAQAALAVLLVFVFTDVGYAALFNSFYSQTASLLFLLLTIGVAAAAIRRGRLEGGLMLAYFVCAFLFVGSKPQETIQAPFLAAFAVFLARGAGPWWRRPAVWLSLLLCLFAAWYNLRTPASFRQLALYDTVFLELLPHSPDRAADLRELGLDPELAKDSGRNPYVAESPLRDPGFRKLFFPHFGYGDLIRFYLAHPSRLFSVVRRGADQALRLRPPALGNFEKMQELPAHTMTRHFAVWSDLRLKLRPLALPFLTLLLAGNLLFALLGYRRSSELGRLLRAGIVLLVLVASAEFLVCVLADSLIGADRHLFVFQALCDLVLIADLTWVAQSIASRWRAKPARVEAA
jgi:hypothetical protein